MSNQTDNFEDDERLIRILRDTVGRLSMLLIAALAGMHYLYETRDLTSEPQKWAVVVVVFLLVGLATTP